jgi:RHS repeat-associated protein
MIVTNIVRTSIKTLLIQHLFQHLAATMLLVLTLAFNCAAQSATDGSTPSGVAPGAPVGSYPLSDFDRINLYNGNLNFSLPLLHISGRGGVTDVVQLKLERKWRIIRGPYSAYPVYSGWQSTPVGYGAGALEGRVANGMVECDQSNDTLLRLTFTAPDGTEYELRDQLLNGAPGVTSKDPACALFSTSRGRVFKTSDGSAATFISDVELTDGNGAGIHPSGYLMMRDGARYRIDTGKVSWQRDRNGNQIDFAYNSTLQATQITDSLGRVVTLAYYTQPGASPDQITYTGFGGTPRSILIRYTYLNQSMRADYGTTAQSYHQLFPELSGASSSPFNPPVVSSVELPDGRSYYFRYNLYGELARVELPTGGAFEYDYQAGLVNGVTSGVMTAWDSQIYRRVVERRVYPDGGTGNTYASRMTVSRPEDTSGGNTGSVTVEQRDSAGVLLSKDIHYYYGSPRVSFSQQPLDYAKWKDGKEWKTEAYASNGTTLLRKVEQTWQQPLAGYTWPLTQAETNDAAKANDPQITQRTTTLSDTNQVSKETFAYDKYSNQTDVYQYDYGTGAPPTYATRHTRTDFLTSNVIGGVTYQYDTINPSTTTPDSNQTIHLRGLPQSQRVYAVNAATGVETLIAQSSMSYDESTYPSLTYGAVTHWSAPGTPARGNPTSTGQWLDTIGDYLWTHAQYDQCGSMINSWDPRSKQSQVSYDSAYAYAYPTTMTSAVPDPTYAHGSNTSLVTSNAYDFYTGHVTSTIDANQRQTTFEHNDVFDRLTKINRPDGGWTSYVYDRNQYGDYVGTQVLQNSSGLTTQSYQFFDKLGRPSRSFQYVNSDPNNAWLTSDKQYDALGRAWKTSNPYMSTGSNSAINPSGNWTQTSYDGLGRVKTVTTPDNAAVVSSYSGNTVTVLDQQGNAKQSVTDALGRLAQLIEDPGAAPAHFNYQTTYTYDALDNLRRVQQGAQNRYFMYDSLSRLVRARNPEQNINSSLPTTEPLTGYLYTDNVTGISQWSTGYTYDVGGNLLTRTDARNTKTTSVYDALNRVITRSYDDNLTPAANFYYDGAALGKGRLWQTITDGTNNSYRVIDSYDAMGRPLSERQEFLYSGAWSQNFYVLRSYDLAGHTLTQTYPSGHSVTYSYDALGRTQTFTGTLGEGTTRTYSTGITYNEWSTLNHEQYGTQTPVYHNRHYNLRGQLYDVRVGSGTDASSEWTWNRGCLQFYYSSNNSWGGSGTDNNGNLLKAINYIPGNDAISSSNTHIDTYGYDALNRLSLVNQFDGSTQTGSQHYDIDQYGNRTINAGTTWGMGINNQQFTVDTVTNRLGVPGGQAGVMSYDAAGNLYNDTYTGTGARTFDAENRMISAADSSYSTSYYTYDADSKRVRRQTGGMQVWQVYGMDGELVAEYAATAGLTSPQKEYGYRNGELLVSASNAAPVNLALNQSATQSSTFSNFPASLAVDNNTNGDFNGAHTSSATNYSYQPWWQLDLSSSQFINSIKLYPRTDCCQEMLASAYLFVSDQPFTSTDLSATLAQAGVSSYAITGNTSGATTININRTGRYLRVQRSDTQYLVLAEVQVWGQQSSAVADVEWLVADQVGTARVVLDQSGSLSGVKRHDYLPFGEELYAGSGGRTTLQGYTGDAVRQKFASKERDAETGLDYFEARYYASAQGRFTSVDPIQLTKARLADPQTMNLYVYARNNPLAYIDPSGLDIIQLGRSAAAINNDIATINEKLKGNLSEAERQKLQSQLTHLQQELQANLVIGEWLAKAQAKGELKDMKLSDLAVMTSPREDLTALYKAFNDKLPSKSRASAKELAAIVDGALQNGTAQAVTIKGQIYVYTNGAAYKYPDGFNHPTFGDVPKSDVSIFGASLLGHERYHKMNGPDEPPAFNEEVRILDKFTPDAKNKSWIKAVRNDAAKHAGKP